MSFNIPNRSISFVLSLILSYFISGQACVLSDKPLQVQRTQFLLGTLVEITVRDSESTQAQRAITRAFQEIRRIESLMSSYLPESEVSRINRQAGGESVTVSREVVEVIRSGIHWGARSQGSLDITLGPIVDLWNFDEEVLEIPDPVKVKQSLQLVDYNKVEIDGQSIRLPQKGMVLQLGSIAKGFAVDRAIETLKSNGIQQALINAGGDLRVLGNGGNGTPWKIGLQHPRKLDELTASFELNNQSVATSGDYQKFFMHGGKRYHHILNPATGLPARESVSATVIGPNAMVADALATAVFVLGPNKGIDLLNSLEEWEGLVIGKNQKQYLSKGFGHLKGLKMRKEN